MVPRGTEAIMSESESEDKGFKVTDRRKFTPEGEPRPDAEAAEGAEKPEAEERRSVEVPRAAEASGRDRFAKEAGPPPDVSLADLVSMLASNALVQMGEMEDPLSGERTENLQGAQLMISLLAMLKTKTKGNLSADEDKMLEGVLYDLRMRFLAKTNAIKL